MGVGEYGPSLRRALSPASVPAVWAEVLRRVPRFPAVRPAAGEVLAGLFIPVTVVFKKRLTPSAASDNTRGVLSFTCGSCPVEGRFHHANVIRQFYIRRTLPLTLQGCLMRRRNAADVWSIRQCLYARYIHRTKCGSRAYLPVT